MAYYYHDPSSYANTFFYSPYTRRRPSPPPMTYYPSRSDPYLRSLAEEQAVRSALQNQVRREREARRRLAEESARTRILEQAKREAQLRAQQQRHRSHHGYPSAYGYPYGFEEGEEGEEEEGRDSYIDAGPYEYYRAPMHVPSRMQPTQGVPKTKSTSPTHPRSYPKLPRDAEMYEEDVSAPKVSIPISSPNFKPKKPAEVAVEVPQLSEEEQTSAAISKALSTISNIRSRFCNILSSFSFPETVEFASDPKSFEPNSEERPKLSYAKCNAPIHGHEDALIRLLQELDAIESHGDNHVRESRRELVRDIEAELARIDTEVRNRWEEARASSVNVEKLSVNAVDEGKQVAEKAVAIPTDAVMEVEETGFSSEQSKIPNVETEVGSQAHVSGIPTAPNSGAEVNTTMMDSGLDVAEVTAPISKDAEAELAPPISNTTLETFHDNGSLQESMETDTNHEVNTTSTGQVIPEEETQSEADVETEMIMVESDADADTVSTQPVVSSTPVVAALSPSHVQPEHEFVLV